MSPRQVSRICAAALSVLFACCATSLAQHDFLAESFSASRLRAGGGSTAGSEFRLISWEMPREVRPGQSVTSKMVWETDRGNPSAVIYASVIGDWAPSSPILILVDHGVQGEPGTRFEPSFTFTAPRSPGAYRVRWILTQAFAPLTEFYGRASGDVANPPGGTWSQAEFVVTHGSSRDGGATTRDVPGPTTRAASPRRASPERDTGTWYAGRWNATSYRDWNFKRSHPLTVALRVEVFDADTGLPLADAEVRLEGQFREMPEQVNPGPLDKTDIQDFRLIVRTTKEGIAVFALSWQDEKVTAEFSSGARTRDKYGVDDIFKVQTVTVRRDDYHFESRAMAWFERFRPREDALTQEYVEDGWLDLIEQTPRARCVLIHAPEDFRGAGDRSVSHALLFEKIRGEDYSRTFDREVKSNLDYNPAYKPIVNDLGPYMVLPLRFELSRLFDEVRVPGESRDRDDRSGHPRDNARDRGESAAEQDAAHRREADQRAEQRRAEEAGQKEPRHQQEERDRQREKEDRAREEREKALAAKAAKSPLGLAVETLTEDNRQQLGLSPGTRGVVVVHIKSGSPADKAGIRAGVVIESVEQRSVSDEAEFESRVAGKRAGDQLTLGTWRKADSRWERANLVAHIRD